MAMVKLQLLMHPERRSQEDVMQASAAAQALGLQITSTGAATLSAEIDATRVQELFGVEPVALPERARSAFDFGAPPGFGTQGDAQPEVPPALRAWVAAVSLAPAYTRMR